MGQAIDWTASIAVESMGGMWKVEGYLPNDKWPLYVEQGGLNGQSESSYIDISNANAFSAISSCLANETTCSFILL